LDYNDLISALLRHTDIRGFELEVLLEPEGVSTYAKIGMPEAMVPQMETFVREYRIEGSQWQDMGATGLGRWHRLRFPVSVQS
jgi:hypothetical protein